MVAEIAAPKGLAPYAIALAANVRPRAMAVDPRSGPAGSCSSYDPATPEAWGGPFRVVCFAQAPLETEIGLDPFLADVAWSWLIDALDAHDAHYSAPSGTATQDPLQRLR